MADKPKTKIVSIAPHVWSPETSRTSAYIVVCADGTIWLYTPKTPQAPTTWQQLETYDPV